MGVRVIAAAVAAGLVVLGALVFFFAGRERGYDPAFDTTVAARAYNYEHPVLLFDEGHNNVHLSTAGYRPFVELLRNDGYDVRASTGEFDAATLSAARVLVIVGARGDNDAEDDPAFSPREISAIAEWVLGGGSLLVATDHWPFGSAAASLGAAFGVEMSTGMTSDPAHAEPERGESHIIFSRDNGLLADHAITNGRNASERITQVLTFTGQSIRGPAGATAFMRLADTAVDAPPTPAQVDRRGGDVRVSMTYADPVSVAGWAQGEAFAFGEGRVVVLGETGMLRANRDRIGPVGMNFPGYDNRQLALNIMHWLSGLD